MNKKNAIKQALFAVIFSAAANVTVADSQSQFNTNIEVQIDVNLPVSKDASNYRPYVAVWVENEKGKVVKTISVWSKEADWLKDMRRWWRKAGRYDKGELDAVSGATRRPGIHTVKWDGTDQQGNAVAPGNYIVNIEAAREHGSRSWVRVPISNADIKKGKTVHTTEAAEELGVMTITVSSRE